MSTKLPDSTAEHAVASAAPSGVTGLERVLLDHAECLRRLIDRRIRPLDCGDEVLQEVFAAASGSPSVPREPDQLLPWLSRVAIRQCSLALRSWVRRRRRESEYAKARELDENRLVEDPIYSLMLTERRESVRNELGRLEPQQRELLLMKYVSGLTYKDIGRRLSMDATTVEYRLMLARKALRQRLVNAGIEEGGTHV